MCDWPNCTVYLVCFGLFCFDWLAPTRLVAWSVWSVWSVWLTFTNQMFCFVLIGLVGLVAQLLKSTSLFCSQTNYPKLFAEPLNTKQTSLETRINAKRPLQTCNQNQPNPTSKPHS
jgi:hypothetical protein